MLVCIVLAIIIIIIIAVSASEGISDGLLAGVIAVFVSFIILAFAWLIEADDDGRGKTEVLDLPDGIMVCTRDEETRDMGWFYPGATATVYPEEYAECKEVEQ